MRIVIAACVLFVSTAATALAAPAVVPEPGTIILLGGGLTALGVLGWRRKRK